MLRRSISTRALIPLAAFALLIGLGFPRASEAHCDTLDGPVVATARTALAAGDVTPVLKWVSPDEEASIRDAFDRTLAVRRQGGAARELADQFFFETLVRLHRAGEGFPYTGLQPTGTPIAPAIRAADAALESGNVDDLVAELTAAISAGIKERFAHTRETRAHSSESVVAGRRYVAAYVEFTHYAEAIEALAAGHAAAHSASPKDTGSHAHD